MAVSTSGRNREISSELLRELGYDPNVISDSIGNGILEVTEDGTGILLTIFETDKDGSFIVNGWEAMTRQEIVPVDLDRLNRYLAEVWAR